MRDVVRGGLDATSAGVDEVRKRSRWADRWYTPVTAAVLALVAVVAVFRMESSGPDYDPQYMRVLVERSMRFGGSYYSNGIHNKGPLEPLVYELAARLGGSDGFWFVIGLFALIAAFCVGAAAAVVARRSGAPTPVAVSVAALGVVHLTLSEADYAGVLYARNMTVAMLSTAFVVAALDRCWATPTRATASAVAVGVTTGLAVQTLLTTCFTASPVLLWAMWRRRSVPVGGRPAWLVMPIVSALSLVSAPIFYRIVGPWGDFVDGWWVYARFMSEGTGRSLGSQIELGWDQLFEYYRERPELVVLVQLWIVVTAIRWHRLDARQRALRVLIACWFVGAWIELVLSQRYSSHYFSVLAVPTILMLATLVGEATAPLRDLMARRRAFALLPVVAVVVAVQVGGQQPFDVGVETAGAVSELEDFTERRDAGIDGRTQFVRASLDLVSEDGDPLLVWTSFPWPYLNLERVSATRYIWKSFLLGEIYLGRTSEEYVLPGTWDRFVADLDDADPTAFVVESVNPVAPGTPFERQVADRFTTAYEDDAVTLALRNDLARRLLAPRSGDAIVLSDGTTLGSCVRLDGELDGSGGPVRFEFVGGTGPVGVISVSVADGVLTAESAPVAAAPWATSASADGAVPVTLVAGERAAILVVDGRIAAAVGLEDDAGLVVATGAASLGSVDRSVPLAESGC